MADVSTAPLNSVQSKKRSTFIRARDTGRLHKGQGSLAATVSIPSKYRTIVTDNSERKGFGSCSKRFIHDLNITDGPDPSQYQRSIECTTESVSFSKRGTGTFASKTKRFEKLRDIGASIAPGQYHPLQQPLKDFNKAPCTSNFHQPIAVNQGSFKKHSTPAPNQYNLPHKITGRLSYDVTASAAFKSKSKRDLMTLRSAENHPAPGSYEVNDDMTKANSRYATAPFKSTTFRNFLGNTNSHPGPGTYNPFDAAEKPDVKRLPRQHYLCIAAPAMPLPPTPPSPGPGHYSLVDYEGGERKYVSGSSFVSSTNRILQHINKDRIWEPGPATYNPQRIGKQSFIYNYDSKWI